MPHPATPTCGEVWQVLVTLMVTRVRRRSGALRGRTPDEVYHDVRPANREPRFEPRPHWPRRSSCAAPVMLVKGRPGVRLEMEVGSWPGGSPSRSSASSVLRRGRTLSGARPSPPERTPGLWSDCPAAP
jgi:hypothetical protein